MWQHIANNNIMSSNALGANKQQYTAHNVSGSVHGTNMW